MTRTPTPPDKACDALIEAARDAPRRPHTHAEHLARTALAHAPERAAAYNLLAAIREQGHHPETKGLLRAGIAVERIHRRAQQDLVRLGSHPHPGLLGDEDE